MTLFQHRHSGDVVEATPGTFRHQLLSGHRDWRQKRAAADKPADKPADRPTDG